jgi:hypothetical protein
MPFDWRAFIEVARSLPRRTAGETDPEALLRTAVSRAYYGAFCFVRNHARDRLGFEPRHDADDHGRLRAHLRGKRRQISQKLDRLRQWRNESDYADQLPFDAEATLVAAIGEADAIVALLTPRTT